MSKKVSRFKAFIDELCKEAPGIIHLNITEVLAKPGATDMSIKLEFAYFSDVNKDQLIKEYLAIQVPTDTTMVECKNACDAHGIQFKVLVHGCDMTSDYLIEEANTSSAAVPKGLRRFKEWLDSAHVGAIVTSVHIRQFVVRPEYASLDIAYLVNGSVKFTTVLQLPTDTTIAECKKACEEHCTVFTSDVKDPDYTSAILLLGMKIKTIADMLEEKGDPIDYIYFKGVTQTEKGGQYTYLYGIQTHFNIFDAYSCCTQSVGIDKYVPLGVLNSIQRIMTIDIRPYKGYDNIPNGNTAPLTFEELTDFNKVYEELKTFFGLGKANKMCLLTKAAISLTKVTISESVPLKDEDVQDLAKRILNALNGGDTDGKK